MRAIAKMKILALLTVVAAVAAIAVVGASGASAAAVTVDLCAKAGSVTMPDSTVVDTWSFVPGDCTTGSAGAGGPVLEANVGDVVTINLTSDLPAGHTASFELAGLPVKDNGDGTFQVTAARPGTFAYQSPGDSGRQQAMGLYGALVVRPTGEAAGFAGSSCSAVAGAVYGAGFDRECVMVLSAIDPAFNADPDNFDMNGYLAKYWMINGKSYPDTDSLAGGAAGSRLLIRYVNAGFDNTSMSLLGGDELVIARDAHPLTDTFMAVTETIPAGATEDALFVVPAAAPPSANGFPLFNRNLHVTNGADSPGGMMTFITP
jgi:FtsP/CotA-like multicopper oxidase with cupredoxin domain